MEKVPQKHTHFSLPIELRFLGIPTRWVPRNEGRRRYLVPLVSQRLERKNERIADPEDVRKRFFKMNNNEESALDFLNSVGVWSAEESRDIAVWSDGTLRAGAGNVVVGEKSSYLTGAFGHRFIQSGRALPWDVDSLCRERDKWRGTMRSEQGKRTKSAKLRRIFEPLPGNTVEEQYIFALGSKFKNTLPVHLEWQHGHAIAVIQPITGDELMKALAWIDVVTDAECKVCQNIKCETEYTHGRTKFCSLECERANTKRAYRHRIKRAEAIIRANSGQSIPKLLERLAGAGIKRKRDWILKAKVQLQTQKL
jgi:hypothetical protein